MNFATVKPNLTRVARTMLLAGCALAGSLGVAQATTTGDDVPTMVVQYGDLNLATEAGARTLYRRLATAARQVCPFEDSKSPREMAYNNTCRAQAIARAVHEINSPQLAALHSDRSRRG